MKSHIISHEKLEQLAQRMNAEVDWNELNLPPKQGVPPPPKRVARPSTVAPLSRLEVAAVESRDATFLRQHAAHVVPGEHLGSQGGALDLVGPVRGVGLRRGGGESPEGGTGHHLRRVRVPHLGQLLDHVGLDDAVEECVEALIVAVL